MMRIPGGAKAISQGAASTVQMTDAVLARLKQAMKAEPECVAAGDGKRIR
jgi:hypothetical protein